MPMFLCSKCHHAENTALSNHWIDKRAGQPLLCSECETGTWHGRFPKRHAAGMHLASDGYLYSTESVSDNRDRFQRQGIRVVGTVQPDGTVRHDR